jgi:glucose/arabinose dehydrogenase
MRQRLVIATSLGVLAVALGLFALACSGDDELPPLTLAPALGGRVFDLPIEVGPYEGDRVFVAERAGRVWVVSDSDPAGSLLLDITAQSDSKYGEGLLSVAFDPSFGSNGHLWVFYFVSPPRPSLTRLSRFTVEEGSVDLGSELVLLELEQPGFNQNGAAIRFGPDDGMLYLSMGDGSASTDPFLNGQNKMTLLGSIIRIDVRESSEAEPYRIPSDNPFVDDPEARPELFAYAMRNPFRMSIDPESGELWLGDVQVSNEEEVDRVKAGDNLGWNIMEGAHCLRRDCDATGLTAPVWTYLHDQGRCAVVGGLVYRGDDFKALRGRYLFGDFCSGEIWSLDRNEEVAAPEVVAQLDGRLVSFGTDADGEVLVLDHEGGGVFRLVEADE